MEKRSLYFQTIARHLIDQRGAPFVLSSKELALVSTWEDLGIPLPVVLEGIKRTFEEHRMKPGRKKRIRSLAFCNERVLEAFEQHKERKVGKRRSTEKKKQKSEMITAEIEKFLGGLPKRFHHIVAFYDRARKILAQATVNEVRLEQIEEEIETTLIKMATKKEKERVMNEVQADSKALDEKEFNRVYRIRLIKLLRDKYKVPYISLFYY